MSRVILAVEDQVDYADPPRSAVERGYEMIEAETASGACRLARRRPDLILMDIESRVIDGYKVTRRIKANPALKSIPVIAVTSHALGGGEEKARAAG